MLIDIEHRMRFEYDDFIRDSQMEIRVEAQTQAQQVVHSFLLTVGPPASVDRYLDWNGNWVHYLSIRNYHKKIEIHARSLVDTQPDLLGLSRLAQTDPQRSRDAFPDFCRFDGPVVRSSALADLEKRLAAPVHASLEDQVMAIGSLVGEEIQYQPGITNWRSDVNEVLEHRSGVCQDFAHVSLGLLRLREIPCRYVSGYLHTESQAAQSHAWIEVYGEGCGWVAYDPTHRRPPTDRYVTVATGRHYGDVAPNRGVFRGNATETFHADVLTESATEIDVVRLRRQTEGIDVPVFSELPARAADTSPRSGDTPDPARQQQQQQQQQSLRR